MKTEKNMMFKVFSSVIYCIMDNYLCVDYLGCTKNKLHVDYSNKGFEKTTYNAVSGIGITKLLIKIILCHRF